MSHLCPRLCTNRNIIPTYERKPPLSCFLLSFFAVIFAGTSLTVSAPLFARRLNLPTRFSPAFLLAFVGGYCYNLLGSALVLLGFPAACSAYFPNSVIGFSA